MDRTVTNSRSFANPLHAILLAFPVALYPAALLTDITYLNTAEIQWSNFSSWLIAGADLFAGLVLASALLALFFGRARHAKGRGTLYLIVIAAMFGLGVLMLSSMLVMAGIPSALWASCFRYCARSWP